MKIYFENSGEFITAAHDGMFCKENKVTIRCNFKYTDCGETETLEQFVERHGGEIDTEMYLKEQYSKYTSI